MKDTLGGKGAGLAEMTNAGLPVPPGFTISTDACNLYYEQGQQAAAGHRDARSTRSCASSRRRAGATLGSTDNPLLVSVRSGAKFSMPGMMDTILNLGLERRDRRRPEGADRQRPLRVRQLPPLHPDVRQRRARDSRRTRSSTSSRRVKKAQRRRARHRPRRGGAARSGRRATRAVVKARDQEGLSRRIRTSSCAMARNAVFRSWNNPRAKEYRRIYDIPDSHRHRRQRADDGVRQHRRSLGHRRRLHPQPGDRREGVLRRVPDQRAGRRRRRRHPHAAADSRARAGDAEGLQAAARDHHAAREALQGHPGLRVHDPGRAAVHAADAQRQAHRLRRGGHRHRPGDGEADHAEGSGAAGRSRSRCRSCWRRGSIPKEWKKIPVATRGLPASPGAASGQVVFTADDAVEWIERRASR